MNDRIDHVAEAQRSDEITQEQWTTFAFETSDASNLYTAIQEQKHATLALVEQQRIANLIALAHVADQHENVSPAEQQAWDALGVRGAGTLRPNIAAALGVDQS